MQSLSVLHIRATNHYEFGKEVGNAFKRQIHEYRRISTFTPTLQTFYDSQYGKELYDQYLNATTECFPEVIEEIRGLSRGAELEFHQLFLMQLLSEVLFIHADEVAEREGGRKATGDLANDTPEDATRCSDVLVNNQGFRMIAHNEDMDKETNELSYFIHVTIVDESRGTTIEEFSSFVVPGELPGLTFAMNKHLVQTVNTLLPAFVNRKSVPVAILLRKLLTCTTIDECARMMKNDPYGCAYGMNINIASIHGNEMGTLEVCPEKDGSTTVSIKRVGHPPSSESNNHLYHFNHYAHTPGAKELDSAATSKKREVRAIQMDPPKTDDDVRNILGDVEDTLFPIYKDPSRENLGTGSRTIATAVFNLTERKLDVYRCCPKGTSVPCVTIPL